MRPKSGHFGCRCLLCGSAPTLAEVLFDRLEQRVVDTYITKIWRIEVVANFPISQSHTQKPKETNGIVRTAIHSWDWKGFGKTLQADNRGLKVWVMLIFTQILVIVLSASIGMELFFPEVRRVVFKWSDSSSACDGCWINGSGYSSCCHNCRHFQIFDLCAFVCNYLWICDSVEQLNVTFIMGNYRFIPEAQKKLIITMWDRGQTPVDVEHATGISVHTVQWV